MFLALIVAIGLMTGCGAGNEKQSASNNNNQTAGAKETESDFQNTTDTTENTSTENTSTGSKKILVVYYSATGNTKDVAEKIAKITDGDLFAIEPKASYTEEDLDWTNDDSRVSREHDDESLRDVELVSASVENWDSYDTVYIGYPIWWGIAAWPVDNFVKNNDFTGKTVIPFCTSASSGLGDSGKLLEEMAGTGDWKEGERFRGGASESDIRSWVDSLGLQKT